MKLIRDAIARFIKDEEGPTAVEYAIMLALILVVCLIAISNIGAASSATFQSLANSLSS
jgi:pilus assembly protein Flp/PilA